MHRNTHAPPPPRPLPACEGAVTLMWRRRVADTPPTGPMAPVAVGPGDAAIPVVTEVGWCTDCTAWRGPMGPNEGDTVIEPHGLHLCT